MANWTDSDLPDLTGQRCAITGATHGIGEEAARALAAHGAELVLLARNPERAAALLAAFGGRGEVVRCDLADQASIRTAAETVDGEIDVLIHNAGAVSSSRQETMQGLELTLGTNCHGPALLNRLLLPQVRRRIVVVGSEAHRNARLDRDDPHWRNRRYQPFAVYAASKLAVMLWARELGARLAAAKSPVDVQLAHPGFAVTNLQNVSRFEPLNALIRFASKPFSQDQVAGSWPTLYAASQQLPPNSYVGPDGRRAMRGHPTPQLPDSRATDPEAARWVWDLVERETV